MYKITCYSHFVILFFDPYKIIFFTICVLLYIVMYTLNFIKAIKKMSAIEIRDIFYENYYKRIGFSKEESYCPLKSLTKERLFSFANKLIKIVADPRNAKEHYESFLRQKNR